MERLTVPIFRTRKELNREMAQTEGGLLNKKGFLSIVSQVKTKRKTLSAVCSQINIELPQSATITPITTA